MIGGPDGLHESAVLADHARSLLPLWNIDSSAAVELLNVSENTTFGIGSDFVLRIHRAGYSSMPEIESELAWLGAVRREAGIATPEVVLSRDLNQIVDSRVVALESDRFAVMFRRLPGVEPSKKRLVELFEPLGEITARLHVHSQTWKRPAGFTRRTWDLDHSIGPLGHWGQWQQGLGVGPAEREVLARCAKAVIQRLKILGTGPTRFGLVHADLRLANLLVDSAGQISVLDFDDSGFSWFGYDLGASLSFIEDHPDRDALIESWCDGYRSVTRLEPETTAELPTFVMLRRLVLTAWFGTHRDTDLARTVGQTFALGSCALAEEFLSRRE
jgi:Ser/Thr protein kinase RdoA (MazF antagonist)